MIQSRKLGFPAMLFAVSWEVVQLVGHQALGLIILVRVQASQPIFNPRSHEREIQKQLFLEQTFNLACALRH
jgi:hypothetical protein